MKMGDAIPSQCPNCGAIAIQVIDVPPSDHAAGDDWRTHAECTACEEYDEWVE